MGGDDFDVAIFDDASVDGTPEAAIAAGLPVFSSGEMAGITFGWNVAYRVAAEYGYPAVMLLNNDVLVPPGAIGRLTRSLLDVRGSRARRGC